MMSKCMHCGEIISIDGDNTPVSHGYCRLCMLKIMIEKGWATNEEKKEYERLTELK